MASMPRMALLLLLLLTPSLPAAPTTAPSSRIHEETRRILTEARRTWYSHRTIVDPSTGTYAVDCSGLVCIILQEAAPAHLDAIPIAPGEDRQRAVEFHDAFKAAATQPANRAWRKIERIADARPGDMIAWRRNVITPGQNTGHIVIVDQPPADEGNGLVRVSIIDSTSIAHHGDSRNASQSGVGRGTMWFKTDQQGRPIGVLWSSPRQRPVILQIAVARAMD